MVDAFFMLGEIRAILLYFQEGRMVVFMVSMNLFLKRDSRQELYENLKRQLKQKQGAHERYG